MKKSKFTETQIIAVLKQGDAGVPIKDLCRQAGISSATYYQWKSKYGGMEASELRRVKELEAENAKLKRMYADLARARASIGERMQRGDSHLLVAELGDGRLGGFVQLYPGFSSVAAARVLRLSGVGVGPERVRRGHGRGSGEAGQQARRETGAAFRPRGAAGAGHAPQALGGARGWARGREFCRYACAARVVVEVG